MIYKSIFGEDLRSFIFNFNERMKLMFTNINEQNTNFNQLEIKSGIPSPTAKADKVIIYMDGSNFKYMKPDGSTGTFTITPDP